MIITQTQLISEQIRSEAALSDLEFFGIEISEWLLSYKRSKMLEGKAYYEGDHQIMHRKRTVIGASGEPEVVKNLPNTKIVDNVYSRMADQKKNYLLGKPVTFTSENQQLVKALQKELGKRFMRTLKLAGEEAVLAGISWLYPYVDTYGKLAFRLFPGYEICPFWADSAHTELDCAARVYSVEVYEGKTKKTVTKVQIYKPDGITTYTLNGDVLVPDGSAETYLIKGSENYNWERLPLIPIKYNARELPLLSRIKQLQDALNLVLSDFVNNMEENVHNTILVLNNYEGTNLGELRKNLATYGVIKTRTVDGNTGGVDTLSVEVNADNYKLVVELLKKAIIENARGFDAKDDRMSGNPNQMNIQSMYSDLDLDANDMETELQAAFEDILWFTTQYLLLMGKGNFTDEPVEVIFNRDILINESEAITNCSNSVGIISGETIVAQHPWTSDPQKELERLNKEKEEQPDAARTAFEKGMNDNG